MVRLTKKERVDSLIQHFWKNGYLTLSRKHGKYLPEPNKIGDYEVDAVGRLNKKFVLGLTLTAEDLKNPSVLRKIRFLANQKNKYTSKPVTLFVGVPEHLIDFTNKLVSQLDQAIQKHIKIVSTTNSEDLFE